MDVITIARAPNAINKRAALADVAAATRLSLKSPRFAKGAIC